MKILAFGDSNTYGYDPRLGGGGRYPEGVRWTGRLNKLEGVTVYNYGMNGAVIPGHPDFLINTYQATGADTILVMLGSNDLLTDMVCSAERVYDKMQTFISELLAKEPDAFDGVHLSEKGHELFYEELSKVLL